MSMKKTSHWVRGVIVIFLSPVLFAFSSSKLPEPIGPKTECKPEDRKVDFCMELFDPVCGWMEKGSKTFSNHCFACKDPQVKFTTPGECVP